MKISHTFTLCAIAVGDDVDILHDAAGCDYTLQDAIRVGKTLEALRFGWFEEPLADRDQKNLQRLCAALDIPILAPETLMHDVDLSAQWIISGATDALRANARLGTTPTLKLAHLAEMHGANIEFNGPGGLFGLVHAHLSCAISNTSYYEFFPGGSRDVRGREIGLLNPPLPENGHITPPNDPGWGAEWDWSFLRRRGLGSCKKQLQKGDSMASDKPNIILILSDDLGYECLGCYGGESYQTPVLDGLSKEGMRFDHAYVLPLCTPTRLQLMTGKYNFRNWRAFGVMDPQERTFGHLMQAAGYKTCISGKWQMYSYNPPDFEPEWRGKGQLAEDSGFDEYCLWHTEHTEDKGVAVCRSGDSTKWSVFGDTEVKEGK